MLNDKVALVTGGSRGIGRAIALELAAAGALVFVNYSGNIEKAEETVKIIKNKGGKAISIKASINIEDEVIEMFKDIEKKHNKTVDILVNNAGITKDNLLIRMKKHEWQEVIDVNLTGAFNCIRMVSKTMIKKQYGKIINISSVVGFSGNAGQINYCATKAGLIGMTKSAALELSGRGIRVNAVAPGFIETDMTSSINEKIKEEYLKNIPLGYIGKTEDIAAAVLYLASPESDYMTGQTLHINGGLYL